MATPAPSAGTPSCDFPEPAGDCAVYCLDAVWWLNHPIYFLVECQAGAGLLQGCLSADEVAWLCEMHASFAAAQEYLGALEQDQGGNYCLIPVVVGPLVLLQPVASPPGGCGEFPRVFIPPAKWAKVEAAFNNVDCANTYLRQFVL